MGYTSERNNQIMVSLLKYHGIRKVVASPGATNVSFVASIQQDPFFEIYSCVDERSAAYMACGLAEQSGDAVVLSCTGATASRNYFPGLTEAYYRKLPVLAITSTMPIGRIGHNIPQVIDRTNVTNDIAKMSVCIPMVKDEEDEWICCIRANEAILELKHHSAGPVHINLETKQSGSFDVEKIPPVQCIDRIEVGDSFPELERYKRIGLLIGAHSIWSPELTNLVDNFCEKYNAVVLCDHTSNYKGKYSIPSSLVMNQVYGTDEYSSFDLVIHIGNISGAYLRFRTSEVWRVNPDGKLCDTYRKLRYVFEMDENAFFRHYAIRDIHRGDTNAKKYESKYNELSEAIPDIPFSNLWIAKTIAPKLPENSILHLGILNSLRSWNFFRINSSISVFSNTGGFGIDGCLSTALGAGLIEQNKIIYTVLGDLAFFYDMNALGNRHFGKNIRILVVNNGKGQEFKNYGHRAAQFGDRTDPFIAAAGHYGNQSPELVKNYVEALGFSYYTADSKESFKKCMSSFLCPNLGNRPMVLEVFTESSDESKALEMVTTLNKPASAEAKKRIKDLIGDEGIKKIKTIIKGK